MSDARLQVTDPQGLRVVPLDKAIFVIGRRTHGQPRVDRAGSHRDGHTEGQPLTGEVREGLRERLADQRPVARDVQVPLVGGLDDVRGAADRRGVVGATLRRSAGAQGPDKPRNRGVSMCSVL